MTDISDLQTRITSALDRIGSGLEALAKAPQEGDTPEVAALRAELVEERTANAQLEERVHAIKDRHEIAVTRLDGEVLRLRALVAEEEEAVARLMRVNAELRANNRALREAISEGVAEPHLVNKSMMAELEGLRAVQAADRAELDAVLGELTPLIEDAQGALDIGEAADD